MALSARLKKKMEEKNITAHALEKKAGLKTSAVHNILYGRSKNPSLNLVQTIAEALDCTLSELLGNNESLNLNPDIKWDCDLYVGCLQTVSQLLKWKKMTFSRQKILECVDEVYLYSLKSDRKTADEHFAEWFIVKHH